MYGRINVLDTLVYMFMFICLCIEITLMLTDSYVNAIQTIPRFLEKGLINVYIHVLLSRLFCYLGGCERDYRVTRNNVMMLRLFST